jgi:hypothetical protein
LRLRLDQPSRKVDIMLKYFTEKNTNASVAVNPQNVASVRESSGGCILYMVDGTVIKIMEQFLDTVTRLNDKKN